MQNRETRDPEIERFKDKIVIGPKRGLKSHNLTRLEAKVEYDINCFANRMSYGLKKQISKLYPKMGFWSRPNMPLSQKSGFKTNLVSF